MIGPEDGAPGDRSTTEAFVVNETVLHGWEWMGGIPRVESSVPPLSLQHPRISTSKLQMRLQPMSNRLTESAQAILHFAASRADDVDQTLKLNILLEICFPSLTYHSLTVYVPVSQVYCCP